MVDVIVAMGVGVLIGAFGVIAWLQIGRASCRERV